MAGEPTSEPVKEEPEMVAVDLGSMEQVSLLLEHRLLDLAGEIDVQNRYLAAVQLTAMSGEQEMMGCSGVAISRRVVLTSGHCICTRRQTESPTDGSHAVIDASACFTSAEVDVLFYEPQAEEEATLRASRRRIYRGKAYPHPNLKILLDEQGRVSSSKADLALIILDKPLKVPGVPLADEDVRVGDSVVIVGYGYDEVAQVLGPERRFSTNQITRLALEEDERLLIEQPGGHRYRQDSGGPCLRHGSKGPELVGISSRWLGEGSAFTSIHAYLTWLRDEIRRAAPPGATHQ